jgi:hypothetical protein
VFVRWMELLPRVWFCCHDRPAAVPAVFLSVAQPFDVVFGVVAVVGSGYLAGSRGIWLCSCFWLCNCLCLERVCLAGAVCSSCS